MKKIQLFLLGLVALGGCKPEKSGIFYLSPEPVFEVKRNPLAADSINAFRPVLGSANVARQFPFGLAGKTTGTPRLVEVIDASGYEKSRVTYRYETSGRLASQTNYYQNGLRANQYSFQYGTDGATKILSEINQESVNYSWRPPGKDELAVSGMTEIEPADEAKSWLRKTYQRNDELYRQESETRRQRLGFDAKGQLVWQEGIHLTGADARIISYQLYRRDDAGNAVFIRSVGNGYYATTPTEEFLTYDDKPNPYRTTGDITSLESTNVNNVLSRKVVEEAGRVTVYRYEYEYRPDGYPSRVRTYGNGELLSTKEFVYNQ